ncbi:MAG: hypothetical protein M1838_002403 [Thelocarpon superellum]|nr:MAG: hypothetical protein M1838_002403 [Thelocarpon superellum]
MASGNLDHNFFPQSFYDARSTHPTYDYPPHNLPRSAPARRRSSPPPPAPSSPPPTDARRPRLHASQSSPPSPEPSPSPAPTTYALRRSPSRSSPLSARPFDRSVHALSYAPSTHAPPAHDDPSDPHDFYRQFKDPFTGQAPGFTQHLDIRSDRELRDGMTTATRPSEPTVLLSVAQSRKYPPPPRAPAATQYSSSTVRAKSTSNNPPRARQTSLQDLVNRFNQDHEGPSPTTKARPPANGRSASSGRPRKSSNAERPTDLGSKSTESNRPRERTSDAAMTPRRRKNTLEEVQARRTSVDRGHRGERSRTSVANNPWASQSMTSLHLAQNESARRPLFGEVLPSSTAAAPPLPGYGIPGRQRRGSDGSSPHLAPGAHRKSRSDAGVSPPAARDWYMGNPFSLPDHDEASDRSAAARRLHRRTRSDFAGTAAMNPHANRSTLDRDGRRPPEQPVPPLDNTQVRAVESVGSLTSSPDPASAAASTGVAGMGVAMARPSSRSQASYLSQSQRHPPSSKDTTTNANLTPTSRRPELHPTSQRGTSPRLKAFISAPPAKMSPPLRSSRPRQPVSSATTASSRAKAVDTSESTPPPRPPRHPSRRRGSESAPKTKHIPELGGVDFAARRERIQRAFTISMREREKQDENRAERRRLFDQRKANECAGLAGGNDPEGTSEEQHQLSTSEPWAPEQPEMVETTARDPDAVRADRRLTLDTQMRSPKSQGAGSSLGVPVDEAQGMDRTPTSAVTIETAETAVTPIENEPQTEQPQLDRTRSPPRHRTVLSQVLQLRESSPSSPTRSQCSQASGSDRDDEESIQIMLGESPVLVRPADKPTNYVSVKRAVLPSYTENFRSRWSVDSYGSSPRLRQASDHEGDSLMGRTDEAAASSESTQPTSYTRNSQRWSGDDAHEGHSGHTTLNSDAYSTINRVLEQYHAPSIASPEMFHDFKQQILHKSPELARQGGWDPTRVTQLYLQELSRGRYKAPRPATPPRVGLHDPVRLGPPSTDDEAAGPRGATRDGDGAPPISVDRATTDDEAERPTAVFELPGTDPAAAVTGVRVPEDIPVMHSASLQFATDWMDASPSIVDWIHPQAADSPIDSNLRFDYRPTPPPKDWSASQAVGILPDRGVPPTSQPLTHAPPDLPQLPSPGEGLGLVLSEPSAPELSLPSPPPLPDHSPPPPPTQSTDEDRSDRLRQVPSMRTPPSPSLYSKDPGSSIFPSVFPEGMANGARFRASEGSSLVTSSTATPGPPPRSTSRPVPAAAPVASAEPAVANASPTPEQRRLTKRRHIIRELLDTEKLFHGDMKVTEEIYKGTSNACAAVTADDVKVLFGNIDQIVAFSLTFFDALRQGGSSVYVVKKISALTGNKRASVATSSSGGPDDGGSPAIGMELTDDEKDRKTFIGEAFGQHMSRLEKVYSEYLRNLEGANTRLQKLQAVPGVVLWLNECRSHAEDLTDTWSLDSLMVKPMQRILKYPLLLEALSEATPEDHPDYTALDVALWEMKAVASRIEDLMKRVHLVEQAVGRKRKESDVRTGLSKAFGRRTERFKQQVGLSEMFDDLDFNKVAEKWDSHVIQLQFAMSDVDKYLGETQVFVGRFMEYVAAIEGFIKVERSNYPEMESKWRKFGMAMRELATVALTEHRTGVQKSVIGPMKTLVKLYDAPQKIIQKRNKRIMDYARFKGVKDRGDKPDKRTQEQGEQFMALNDTLKEELPRLYALTSKLAEACLCNLIQLQAEWYTVWQEKSKSILDEYQVPRSVSDILTQFAGDFAFTEAQVHALGICNGSMLADSAQLLSVQKAQTADEASFRRHGPPLSGKARTRSVNSSHSPVLPAPDFGQRHSGSFMPPSMIDGTQPLFGASHYGLPPVRTDRTRASSNQSSSQGGPLTPDVSSHARSFYAMTPATSNTPSNTARPSTSAGPSGMDQAPYARPSTETSSVHTRPASGSTSYFSLNPDGPARQPSPAQRPFSGMFSSAMPMSDSPRSSPHPSRTASPRLTADKAHVLFTTASIDEFNIDRSRMEAGYPYLTYVKGEIFDVLAEKGELWLARNQDDRTQTMGWLWCKHFAKLTNDS